jgi:hypothetical protein
MKRSKILQFNFLVNACKAGIYYKVNSCLHVESQMLNGKYQTENKAVLKDRVCIATYSVLLISDVPAVHKSLHCSLQLPSSHSLASSVYLLLSTSEPKQRVEFVTDNSCLISCDYGIAEVSVFHDLKVAI